MSITTLTSREFNQQVNKAKTASAKGPVVITDRGEPSHVLLTFAAYKKLTSKRANIAELLAMPSTTIAEPLLPARTKSARSVGLD
jgi:prevent-host-death family protein